MSERGQQLYEAFKGIARRQVDVLPAIVKAINGNTVDVEVDGLLIEGVQLQATEGDGIKGILIKPVIDSVVLLQRILDKQEYSVAMYSAVSEIVHEAASAKILINDNGIGVYGGGENLLDVMVDLIDACTTERHLTKSGPTINMSAESKLRFDALKTRVKKLLQNDQ